MLYRDKGTDNNIKSISSGILLDNFNIEKNRFGNKKEK